MQATERKREREDQRRQPNDAGAQMKAKVMVMVVIMVVVTLFLLLPGEPASESEVYSSVGHWPLPASSNEEEERGGEDKSGISSDKQLKQSCKQWCSNQ